MKHIYQLLKHQLKKLICRHVPCRPIDTFRTQCISYRIQRLWLRGHHISSGQDCILNAHVSPGSRSVLWLGRPFRRFRVVADDNLLVGGACGMFFRFGPGPGVLGFSQGGRLWNLGPRPNFVGAPTRCVIGNIVKMKVREVARTFRTHGGGARDASARPGTALRRSAYLH